MYGVKDQHGFHQYELTEEFVFAIDIGPYGRKEVKDCNEPIEEKISALSLLFQYFLFIEEKDVLTIAAPKYF